MSEEHTPTTAEIESGYVAVAAPEFQEEHRAEFRRWLAEHDAEVERGAIAADGAKLAELREALERADQSVAWAHGDDWTPNARKAHNDLRRALAAYLGGER